MKTKAGLIKVGYEEGKRWVFVDDDGTWFVFDTPREAYEEARLQSKDDLPQFTTYSQKVKHVTIFEKKHAESSDKRISAIEYVLGSYVDDSKGLPAVLLGDVAKLFSIFLDEPEETFQGMFNFAAEAGIRSREYRIEADK